jgi:hypothetical protein
MNRKHAVRTLVCGATIALSLSIAATAWADAAPIRPLPEGPKTTVIVNHGSLLAVAVPRPRSSTGLVWRLARRIDPAIQRQVSEAEVGPSVVLVFRATGIGTARVALALTLGDGGSTAVRAAFYSVRVR